MINYWLKSKWASSSHNISKMFFWLFSKPLDDYICNCLLINFNICLLCIRTDSSHILLYNNRVCFEWGVITSSCVNVYIVVYRIKIGCIIFNNRIILGNLLLSILLWIINHCHMKYRMQKLFNFNFLIHLNWEIP